ncbi:MAG: hypothetical protein J6V22_03955 [Clostridia bacterium]|nr:hypothetical protein [Clostridia bacterium]
MNDEVSVLETQNQDASTPHDFMAQPSALSAESVSPKGEEAPIREPDETASSVFADTGANTDSGCEDSDPTPQKSELDELRSELMQLRKELDDSYARLAKMEHIDEQFAEFSALYPNTSIQSIPQEVWQSVKEGNSLAAAFALAQRRHALSLQKATDSNTNNRARSAGAVKNAESVEFSPAEVRAMSSEEVRANLSKIMRSMQKWH